ncbi:MAG: hypothetical protein J6O54_03500 [Prevotella sp.]|nr:hypothetical protein [Prevotella sp.]
MRLLLTSMAVVCCLAAVAQQRRSLVDSLHYRVEMQATLSNGDHTPLWLNANRYGLSSLKTANGYLRGAVSRPLQYDSLRRWGIGYALDVVVPTGFTSHFVVQQAYAEVRWLKGVLTVGSKEWPMELKNQQLSSGSQTLGINARPIPQLRLALPDYWTLPFSRGWLALKGHLAYGMQTDTRWQRDFTHGESKYVEHALYHSKAGYLRIGPKNITLELGLEMACQFGGTTYETFNGNVIKIENESNFSSFFHAFIPGGGEKVEDKYRNTEGNNLGSWLARLNFDYPQWSLGLYADHFFEDHSAMFLLDYDGYGSGANWNSKRSRRYLLYDLKDMLWGLELNFKRFKWIDHVVLEYIYTKYQSGSVYHDHTRSISDHIGGMDDYYNHYVMTGWQHWGQVMGNPLYRSPLYNTDGEIAVQNNRFEAVHFGLSGRPTTALSYRMLATWQSSLGRYKWPFHQEEEHGSLLLEATYRFSGKLTGWIIRGGFGADFGRVLGNNRGCQITITKIGLCGI